MKHIKSYIKIIIILNYPLFITLCLLFYGCATQKPPPFRESTSEKPKPVEVYEPDTGSIDTTKKGPVTAKLQPETTFQKQEQTILGFRVQVFATASKAKADEEAMEARAKLAEKAYVEFIPPLYKVRVGNCLTQKDAQDLKQRAIDKGYKTAFIVETRIEK